MSKYKRVNNLFNIGSFAVSVIAILVSVLALWTAREADRRASGRTLPQFSIWSDTTHLMVIGEHPAEESVRLRIVNLGAEPIQRMRFEISMHIIWAGDRGLNQAGRPTRYDHEFSEILKPGNATTLDILPEILKHMKSLSIPEGTRHYWAPCSVVCSAQLPGQAYFASTSHDDKPGQDYQTNDFSVGVTWKSSTDVKDLPQDSGVTPSPR
jgi:hypothetical protein